LWYSWFAGFENVHLEPSVMISNDLEGEMQEYVEKIT
jgi:hypothetical protein